MDVRYSFTAQFLRGATLFARRSREIEDSEGQTITEDLISEHRACVVAAIMQSAAALESEMSEILLHGPGHHLGSDRNDHRAHDFLIPLADIIDDEPTLNRYDLVLHLLNKPPLNHDVNPYQDTNLLIKLRNEIIHYKSKWGEEMERQKLFTSLKNLRFEKPKFVSPHTNFFPHQFLSASCASWVVITATNFIDHFFSLIDFTSPLAAHRQNLVVPPVQFKK